MNGESEITRRVVGGLLSVGTEQQVVRVFRVSYVPHALKDECVNFAVIMVGDTFADVRFVHDWQHILALDPEADIGLLTALTGEIREKLRDRGQLLEMLQRMQDSWANTVQLSLAKACLTEDPAIEIETLASQYL